MNNSQKLIGGAIVGLAATAGLTFGMGYAKPANVPTTIVVKSQEHVVTTNTPTPPTVSILPIIEGERKATSLAQTPKPTISPSLTIAPTNTPPVQVKSVTYTFSVLGVGWSPDHTGNCQVTQTGSDGSVKVYYSGPDAPPPGLSSNSLQRCYNPETPTPHIY